MKSLTTLAIAIVLSTGLVTGCQTESAPQTDTTATPVVFDFGGASTAEMHVPDMMCQYGCAAKVKEVLTALEGVEDVKIDFESRRVGLAIDKTKFDAETAVAALVDYQFSNTKLIADGLK